MRTSENSMDLIEKSEKMVVIGSECGYGLKPETMEVETKRCSKCGRVLQVSDFNKNKKANTLLIANASKFGISASNSFTIVAMVAQIKMVIRANV